MEAAAAPKAADSYCNDSHSVKWMFGIEILMLCCALVIGFLTILRTYARRSAPLHYAINIVSRLSLPFITYTINTAEDAKGSTSPLFVVSAVILHLIYSKINIAVTGERDFFGARPEDIWNKLFPAGEVVGLIWIGFLLLASGKAIPKRIKVPTCVIIGLSIIQVILNYLSLYFASASLAVGKNPKLVRSYMAKNPGKLLLKGEEKQTIEPVKTGGYSISPTKEADLITLDDVLSYRERDNVGEQIRDTERSNPELCISFALFKLLRAQLDAVRHQPADESSNPTAEAQTFLRQQLLHKAEADYKRMFRVIERELAFLNDYLFSTLPFAFHRWFPFLNILVLFLLLLCCLSLIVIIVIAASFFPRSPDLRLYYSSFIYKMYSPILHEYYKSLATDPNAKYLSLLFYFDVSVCLIILMAPVGMDAWEIFTYLSSDWVRVALFCKDVKYHHSKCQRGRPSLVQKALHLLCRFNTQDIVRPHSWSNKLNQRCILKRSATKSVKVPDAVKEGIFNYLKRCEGRLSNGSASLYRNRVLVGDVEEFADACRLESHTERILVWHIATSQCEDQHADPVASCLSRYCCYLLTSHPELMGTDDTEWVRKIVQDVAKQFGPNRTFDCLTQFIGKRKKAASEEDGQSAPAKELECKGKKLGSRLMEIEDEKRRWKILADVWIEMVMYLAASGVVEAHTDLLGQGGEFITHVWALLYHLGIN